METEGDMMLMYLCILPKARIRLLDFPQLTTKHSVCAVVCSFAHSARSRCVSPTLMLIKSIRIHSRKDTRKDFNEMEILAENATTQCFIFNSTTTEKLTHLVQ